MPETQGAARANQSPAASGASSRHAAAVLPYRPDIDGLRAVAVLAVAFCHAGLPGFAGGFVGVDVFFVISGFLITQILVREIDGGSFSLLRFYERRIRRIFPALFAVQLAALGVGCWLLLPDDLVAMAKSVVATTFFSANFLFYGEAGYFDAPSLMKPLLHTWSLAVEEQFYIVFPALLLLARGKLGGRYVAPAIATVAVSFALCLVGTNNFREADFYLAPTRAWELGLGCLLALGAAPRLVTRAAREVAAFAGVALIAYAVLRYSDNTKFPGVTALPPCLGAALVLWAGIDGSSAVGRLLSTPPAVFVGLISYSLYLWHWPLLVFASYVLARPLGVGEAGAIVALSVLIAVGSWRYIERPFRGGASRIGRTALFRGAAAVSLATAAAGLALALTGGLPGRVDETVTRLLATRAEKDGIFAWCNFKRKGRRGDTWSRELGDPNAAAPSFIVWGDSHACMLAEPLDELARRSGRRGYLACGGGCPPFLLDPSVIERGACTTANERVFEALRADPGLRDVVMIGRWALYFEGQGYKQERIRPPFQLTGRDGTQEKQIGAMVERTAAQIADLGRSAWIVGPVPEVGVEVASVLARARMRGRDVEISVTRAEYLERQRAVLARFERMRSLPRVHVLLPHERLCGDTSCDVVRGGSALYWDDDHLSREGASVVAPILEPIFTAPGSSRLGGG
ncbi:MAG: acyltransferase family protein [Myxococcota bacterium]